MVDLKQARIGVVVPAYNEEMLIAETLKAIPAYIHKIYVVDDCSTDRTGDIVRSFPDRRIVYSKHKKNRGVGGAVSTGYKLALKDLMDIAVVMAGDNQMDPAHLPALIKPVLDGLADATKGDRLIKGFRTGMTAWRSAGNYLLTFLNKLASGYWHVSDPQNGYTATTTAALKQIDLDRIYKGYAFENDMMVRLNVCGARMVNVPIPARYGREKSKIWYPSFIVKTSVYFVQAFLWRIWHKYLSRLRPIGLLYAAGMALTAAGIVALALGNIVVLPVGVIAFAAAAGLEMTGDARVPRRSRWETAWQGEAAER